MSLFGELKRRNVFRVGAAYVVTAWLIIQVVETLFPIYNLSDAAVRLVVNLLAIGLVPVLVLAWVFEWTPEGLKKERDADHQHPASLRAARRLDRMILVVLALALGYFIFDKFLLDPARDAEKLTSAVEQAREQGRTEAKAEVRDSSVAVLAFQDLSPAGDQAYFGDGLAVDLINQLGKVPDLRVTGKTSAFSFKDKAATIPEIGEALNVGHVLDGSVSKAGDRVRISVQLVDTRQDTQLWAQTYDRTLDDIFAIRDEITFRIYDRLTIEFERLEAQNLKTDPEVYDLTLQARHIFDIGDSSDKDRQAAELLAQALAIDPNYVPALLLSIRVDYMLLRGGEISDTEQSQKANESVERVLAIDPDNGEALIHMAWEDWEGRLDLESAARGISGALRTAPGNLVLTRGAGMFARSIGRHKDSIALLERCVAADPLERNCTFQLAQSYLWGGQLEDAMKAHRRLESLTGQKNSVYYVVLTLLLQGKPALALTELEAATFPQDHPMELAARAMIMHDLGRFKESKAAFDRFEEQFEGQFREDAYLIAEAYAWTGQADSAFEWLEKGYALDERFGLQGYWFHRIMFLPIWQKLHGDPRWEELRGRMNMSSARLEAIEFSIPEWMSTPGRPL
jgi:TolB-like protein